MNRRGKRLAFTVAATGLAVVLALGCLFRRVVFDHLEAWRFQFTTETETIPPASATARLQSLETHGSETHSCELGDLLPILGLSAVMEPRHKSRRIWWPIDKPSLIQMTAQPELVKRVLESNKIRVLEQRFPRRAYVVIRDQGATR